MLIQIFVKDTSSHLLRVDSETKVGKLREILFEKSLVGENAHYGLSYQGHYLENDKKLSDYDIGDLSTIFLNYFAHTKCQTCANRYGLIP